MSTKLKTKIARKLLLLPHWSYIALVRNESGIHEVFYGATRPQVGASCEKVAKPNRIVGWRRELADQEKAKR